MGCGSQASLRGQRGQLLPSGSRPRLTHSSCRPPPPSRPSFHPAESGQFSDSAQTWAPLGGVLPSSGRQCPPPRSGGGPAPRGAPLGMKPDLAVSRRDGGDSQRLPSPSSPPAEPRTPAATHPQRPASRLTGPGGSRRPHIPGAPPLPLRPVPLGSAPRGGGSADEHGAMDQRAESFLGGKRRDRTGRGWAGRDGRAAGRRGGRARRKGRGALPHRKRWGGRCRGVPRPVITTLLFLNCPSA